MFHLVKITDLVQIKPIDFGKPSYDAIEDNIHEKYSNKVQQNIGLYICLWDILFATEGLIGEGDGMANVNVEFRMVVFRPYKDEIIIARIGKQTAQGIQLRTDFFEDIWVPDYELPDGSEFLPNENDGQGLWVWEEDETKLYFDMNEIVRLRVLFEEWNDQAPTKPREESADVVAPTTDVKPPYRIIGSMKEPGLGCFLWWD
ncbi:RNA polymerase III subunit Rpc25-domain-containing protein [Podospora australis]|uniref:DNA-directed RNA polymerase subunit n=1 Tax=Podospora australis TaxID=1536484 RepID=A0AAN6WYN2_9PEZI|nr:RNA polymerase III subunit Rpc25-domain-containing protein [Podospora australis]